MGYEDDDGPQDAAVHHVALGSQLTPAVAERLLADPLTGPEDRAALTVRMASFRQNELTTKEFLAITEEALESLAHVAPNSPYRGHLVMARAMNAALNVMVGNLVNGLEVGARLESEPSLDISARNSLAITFQYAGAYELAADTWTRIVEEVATGTTPHVVTIMATNLLEALTRDDLRRPDAMNDAGRQQRIETLERSLATLDDDYLAKDLRGRLALASVEILKGNMDAADQIWGGTDALAIDGAATAFQLYASFETRLALYRRDYNRASDLIAYNLAERQREATLPLVRVEANLQRAALCSAKGDDRGAVAAAHAAVDAALAPRWLPPEVLINEIRQRVLTENAQIELEKRAKALAEEARVDSLTGLATRRALDEAVEDFENSDQELCVLFIDIDRFKQLNDRYGHHRGDQVLAAFGRLLRAHCRPSDIVVRYGGEEFLVLAPVGPEVNPGELAESVRSAVADHNWGAFDLPSSLSCSVGVAIGPAHDFPRVLQASDLAVCEAKRLGRNRVVVSDAFGHELAHRSQAEELSRAIEERQFSVHYQPIWDVQRGTAVGLEALVRWDHPERGRITPSDFVPAAEALGLIDEIDELVWQKACADLSELRRTGDPLFSDLFVSLNMSTHDLASPRVAQVLSESLDRWNLPPDALVVEVTETRMAQPQLAIARLEELQALGVQVALDDFGTGYSTLAQIHRLPIDILKVDSSFVNEPLALERVLSHIIELSTSMGLRAAVEGIETIEQLAAVREMGAALAQGFLLAKPATLEDCVQAIRDAATGPLAAFAYPA